MGNKLTRKLVLGALFAALTCIVTLVVRWPLGSNGAYLNAGDSIIYTAGVAMSGPWAAAAAGIGSMLADLIAGSASYAPGTLVIKALMGLTVGLALYGRKTNWLRYLVFMVLGSFFMAGGYALYDYFIFGSAAMIFDIVPDLIQAAAGVAIGLPLALLVRRIMPGEWLDTFKKG
jgi:uncharacterized membrane protein